MTRRWPPLNGLIDAAEAIRNPWALSYGAARLRHRLSATPIPLACAGRPAPGLVIAQDSGNRCTTNPTWRASWLALRPNTATRWPRSITSLLAIRNYHDSGNTTVIRAALAASPPFSIGSDAIEPAATIAGFALGPVTTAWIPELTTAIAHLRDVLGDQTYESFARKGETMTTAAMVTYAYDQIDQARAELNAVSE